MRNTAAREIEKYCQDNQDGFLIAGDAGFGVWENFQNRYPKQYINTGINEQATIGFASGMALSGHKVFYYNIIPFVLMRCYEQVRIDICYQNLPVILIGIGSGITYAPAGMTHYSVEDIALAKTMPNLNIISPSDPIQVKKAIEYAIESKNPTYIRISRSGEPILFDDNIDITKPNFINKSDSKNILILHGSIVDEVSKILDIIDINIVTVPMLTSSFEWEQFVEKYENIFTYEEHFINGGLGTILLDKVEKKIIKFGLPNEYIHKIGDRDFLREYYKIDGKSIGNKIKDILNG